MSKKDFVKVMKILSSAYNRDFTEDDLAIWYSQFKNEDFNMMFRAVNNIIKTSRYVPTIADILYEIKKIEMPDLTLSYEDEFENVRKAIRKYGIYKSQELMESLKPKTAETVRRIGLQRLCECEQDKIKFIKNEFQDIFEHLQDYEKQECLIGSYSLIRELGNKKLEELNE